jgi:RNase P/RNase MRP subunit p30
MFRDIVIPENNEKEFVEIAEKLGIKKLYFLYNFNEFDKNKTEKRLENIRADVNFDFGVIVTGKNFMRAAKESKLMVAKSSGDDRMLLESRQIKLIFGFEELFKKDTLLQKSSGLNHILCNVAKENNCTVGFSYSSLFRKTGQESALIMGRMMQNIRLCRKYNVKTVIGCFSHNPFDLRSGYDLAHLFKQLGMDGHTINDSLSSRI